MLDVEIIDSSVSGGANTSHTLLVGDLVTLLDQVPRADAGLSDYMEAVVEHNVLGKDTDGGRRRNFRYLRELYLLRPDSILFRALRDLWWFDDSGRPLLAGVCALARDTSFRASAAAIVRTTPGDELTSRDLAAAVEEQFPTSYKASTLAVTRPRFRSPPIRADQRRPEFADQEANRQRTPLFSSASALSFGDG